MSAIRHAAIGWTIVMTLTASYGFAQQPSDDSTGKVFVKEGTEVELKFTAALSSKTAVVDDKIELELEKDFKIDKTVIAKAGTKAVGRVTNAKSAGAMGKAGELNMRLEYLLVGSNRVRLRASKSSAGQGKEGTAIALTVLFGPLGLLKKGKDVEIKTGQSLKAYVDEDAWVLPMNVDAGKKDSK